VSGDAQAVRDALTALDEAFERRGRQAVLELCTDDVVFIGSGQDEEAVGRQEIPPRAATIFRATLLSN
jgi:ketosteroid isomerase-like protein